MAGKETLITDIFFYTRTSVLIETELEQIAVIPASAKDTLFEMSLATGGQIPEQAAFSDALPADDLRSAAVAIWLRSLEKIKAQISPQSYATWFEPLVPKSLQGTTLRLLAPSGFI